MRLVILLGFHSASPDAPPTVLYCGRSNTEAEEVARADTEFVRHEFIRNPIAIRKANPRANAARPRSAAPPPVAPVFAPAEGARTKQQAPSAVRRSA